MTGQELLQIRDLAEDGKVQFKERITDKYDIGCEMVALIEDSKNGTSMPRNMFLFTNS